ncbi:MAG TPA: TRAP transporter large permease subunit [Propylenella sp.]
MFAEYPRHFAAAVDAAPSTGGQITLPIMGAAAFLMREFGAGREQNDQSGSISSREVHAECCGLLGFREKLTHRRRTVLVE